MFTLRKLLILILILSFTVSAGCKSPGGSEYAGDLEAEKKDNLPKWLQLSYRQDEPSLEKAEEIYKMKDDLYEVSEEKQEVDNEEKEEEGQSFTEPKAKTGESEEEPEDERETPPRRTTGSAWWDLIPSDQPSSDSSGKHFQHSVEHGSEEDESD